MRFPVQKICALAVGLTLCLAGAAMSAPAKHAPKGPKCRAGKSHQPKRGKAKGRRCAKTAHPLISDDALKPQEVKMTPSSGSAHEPARPVKQDPAPAEEPLVDEEAPAPDAEALPPGEVPPPLEEAPVLEEVPAPVEEPPATEEAPAPEEAEAETLPPTPRLPARFFSSASFWNTPVPVGAPVASDSEAVVGALVAKVEGEMAAKTGPSINTTKYSVPIYTVPAAQPPVEVRLETAYKANALREAFTAVPLPPNAQPAVGGDHHLVVWQPSTDRLWEFWGLEQSSTGWHAGWGGAVASVSTNSGSYDETAWPGATTTWGASASSLSIAGGVITFDDLESGRIDHALTMSVSEVRSETFYYPAHRTDGRSANPLSLPEGAHLRLDPNLDLSSLHLPQLTLEIAEAAQKYGIFVRDKAGNVAFNAQDPVTLGYNPYTGPEGFFEGSYPRQLLSAFPWRSLELLVPDEAAGA
jgi:hypothetical protein